MSSLHPKRSRDKDLIPATEGPLDPELAGLLDELADENGRQLLTRLATWKKPATATATERLSPGSPFLSRLERHLLDVYRNELGSLVEEACLELLLSEPAFRGLVHPNRDAEGRPILPREHSALRADRDRLEPLLRGQPPCGASLSVLDRLIGGMPRRKSELLVFALAGSRVQPSDAFKIYAARGFEAIGDLEEAERRLLEVFHGPVHYRRKVVAACSLGKIAEGRGRLAESVAWYEQGATLKQSSGASITPWAIGAASWTINSILLGDQGEARKAFHYLSQEVPPKDPSVRAHCQNLRAARLAGTWIPDEKICQPVLAGITECQNNETTKSIRAIFE